MKKNILLLSFIFCLSFSIFAQSEYQFFIDLNKCENDLLTVELIAPQIESDDILYRLPKMVPGTYEIYNFGRFASEFEATDSTGKNLTVEKVDANSWKINDAKKLHKITYKVEDTWDTKQKESFVFEPAGSNFEKDKNFVLNVHCMFGFFEGMLSTTYKLNVTRPSNFYGSSSLTDVTTQNNTDTYTIKNYYDFQDAPIMYNVPDTTILNVGGAQILISVYSPNKVSSSKFIGENIKDILIAQQKYLGGSLPIKKYAYLIYLTSNTGGSGSNGALEHSYSSMYFMPEMDEKYLAQTMRDVSAHEFFHIVTPLNIHAEQIGNFDYSNPKMSKHLWLYEGITEYAAGLVQIKYGIMTLEEYLKVIDEKIKTAQYYNDSLPFTVMSEGCLDKYKDEYTNVYQKGALIGLCLDIKLRALSDGKYGVQEMMADLSKKYGKETSFKDEELFDEISKLSFPEIREFFKRYVEGSEPLPLKEYLELAGIGFGKPSTEKSISFGGIQVGLNAANNHLIVVNTAGMDDFGKAIGYQEYDELLKFNGKKININNAQDVLGDYLMNAKEGDVLKISVLRRSGQHPKGKKVKLKTKVFMVTEPNKFNLAPVNNASQQQMQIRSSWIGK